jgi:hypothetical protein
VRFGVSVDGAGDVNGDGFDDIIVGADRFSNGQAEEGRAFVFHGGQNGMVPGSVAESDQPFAALGSSVAGAGDVDADGYDDVIVGAQYYSHGQTYEGRGWLFSGTPGGISLLPYWMAESDQEAASFGASVAGAGDVNGDGRPDVIVGASEYNTTQPNVGRVFAYYGGQLLPVGVPPADRLPARLELSPPAPNPVRGDAVFRYRLPAEGRARLSVHDVMGRTVAVLADGSLPAGPHATRWTLTESAGVPAGVYVARLEFAGGVVTRRIAVTL